jgi:hypothetical protein
MTIYKCADCNAVSYAENNFRCQSCGGNTIGFQGPTLEDNPRIDFRAIAYGVGVGILFLSLGIVIILGMFF